LKKEVYTVGHSSRSLEELIAILKDYKISLVVDVRRFPTSRLFPHFKKESLERALEENGVKYIWLGDLLGGFREGGYLEYMRSEEFEKGFRRLLDLIESNDRVAILCREKLWFKCHRRFISDKLVREGYKIIHIIDRGRTYERRLRGL